ncbi:MAG: preprotein translocase subunit YajC [Muribaculaceae bacterium]|nr:preprotein translocase subunit YajC [Bacteroidales bacterium]MDE6242940.1 preprotein translocase subunit YajC [Muribaculaceae bacterium]
MLNTILAQQAQQGGGYTGILMIVAMVVIFYFFMIRPQNKKQKEIKKAREAMQKGDAVVTAGGIYGRIKEVKETTFIITIADGVNIKIEKTSVYAAPAAGEAPAKDK